MPYKFDSDSQYPHLVAPEVEKMGGCGGKLALGPKGKNKEEQNSEYVLTTTFDWKREIIFVAKQISWNGVYSIFTELVENGLIWKRNPK